MKYRALLGMALVAAVLSPVRAREAVWIEGEAAARHTFKKHGWYDGVHRALLSGGDWLSHYSGEGPGEATYRFTVKQGATLTFKGSPIVSVKAVDIYGVPTEQEVLRDSNTFTIDGRYATYYYEVKR